MSGSSENEDESNGEGVDATHGSGRDDSGAQATSQEENAAPQIDAKQRSGFYTPTRRKRPNGRKAGKEDEKKEEASQKKLKIAETALSLQKQQVDAMKQRNEMLAFTSGPGGVESPEAKEYFSILRQEAISSARRRLDTAAQPHEQNEKDGLDVLGETASDIVDLCDK